MKRKITTFVYYCKYLETSKEKEHDLAVSLLKRGFLELFQTELRENAVQKDTYGKPYYAENPNLKFNITHCKGGVAVALSGHEVGVDAESMRQVNDRTVKKSCNREECTYVFGKKTDSINRAGMLNQEEANRFLTLWTLKESYVKMTGKGLFVPFDTICFTPPDPCSVQNHEVTEVKSFDGFCRHYLYVSGHLILALTLQWEETDCEPDLVWKEYPCDLC